MKFYATEVEELVQSFYFPHHSEQCGEMMNGEKDEDYK